MCYSWWMAEPEIIEADVVLDLEPGEPLSGERDQIPPPASAALAVLPDRQSGQLIVADDPVVVLQKATEIAGPLRDLIEKAGLAANVGGGKKHIEVSGWQACGAMLGALGGQSLHAETVWSRRMKDDDGKFHRTKYTATVKRYHRRDQGGGLREEVTYEVDGFDWEARAEVRTAGGVIVGADEAMVGRDEETWNARSDYALRSMASTRAESRAWRRALGWIVNLAGYSPTPKEEMPPEQPEMPWWALEAAPDKRERFEAELAEILYSDSSSASALIAGVQGRVGFIPALLPALVGGIRATQRQLDERIANERG